MAIYRNIQLSFWTDNKVEDEFTPEDKYFYLYLMTNPQTNICGCYEVSYSQLTNQTGYSKDTIIRLLDRFENEHKVIKYSKTNKEILLLNWYKYNWSKSEKVLKGVLTVAQHIKTKEFQKYVINTVDKVSKDTLSIPYAYTMETSVSDSDTDIYILDNNINNNTKEELNELEKNFNIIYNSYPKKVGKSKGYEHYLQWLKGRVISGRKIKLTNKQIWNAISRYKKQCEDNDTELQYYKNFDIFMNKAILDYVEED